MECLAGYAGCQKQNQKELRRATKNQKNKLSSIFFNFSSFFCDFFGASLAVYKTLPVDPRGVLKGTGDPTLDGDVEDAFDLIDRLAKSEKVRQSIIRHAFRYFLGRNETLSDSKTLIDADRAYVDNEGSLDEVIVSLLTSDSFIYRKRNSRD